MHQSSLLPGALDVRRHCPLPTAHCVRLVRRALLFVGKDANAPLPSPKMGDEGNWETRADGRMKGIDDSQDPYRKHARVHVNGDAKRPVLSPFPPGSVTRLSHVHGVRAVRCGAVRRGPRGNDAFLHPRRHRDPSPGERRRRHTRRDSRGQFPLSTRTCEKRWRASRTPFFSVDSPPSRPSAEGGYTASRIRSHISFLSPFLSHLHHHRHPRTGFFGSLAPTS